MIGRGKRRRPLTRVVCEGPDGRVVDLHALRTTLGTNLTGQAVTVQLAQPFMRHSDYRTTQKHYTDLGLPDTAKAVDRLPGISGPAETKAVAAADGTFDGKPANASKTD